MRPRHVVNHRAAMRRKAAAARAERKELAALMYLRKDREVREWAEEEARQDAEEVKEERSRLEIARERYEIQRAVLNEEQLKLARFRQVVLDLEIEAFKVNSAEESPLEIEEERGKAQMSHADRAPAAKQVVSVCSRRAPARRKFPPNWFDSEGVPYATCSESTCTTV